MKLAPRTFQIFWDAHAWSGVIASLLLYVMFLMGAFALFYPEIDAWAEPAPALAQEPAVGVPPKLQPLLEELDREYHVLGAGRVAFMPERGSLRAYVRRGEEYTDLRYSPEAGRLVVARSGLGTFLYSLHYLGPIPYGIYVAGVASMALLLALISGLFIHLKDLLRQWFQFRPERVLRTWSSDMHKVLGVFGLPYQLMYAWTGAVLGLGYGTLDSAFQQAVFGGQEQAMQVARGESARDRIEPTGKLLATLPDLDAAVAAAERRLPGLAPTWIGIEHVGDESSSVAVYGDLPGAAFGNAEVLVRARDAELLSASEPGAQSSYQRFEAWFYGLHYARFGGYGIKLLYALLALASCAVIATGNLVWLERRDLRRQHVGNRILSRLSVGFFAGVFVATAAAFLANRLLPGALPRRGAIEQWVFWGAWLPALLAPFLKVDPRRAAAVEIGLSAAAFAVVVALDQLGPGASAGPVHAAVRAGLAGLALSCALVAVLLWRRGSRRTAPPASPESIAPAPA